MVLTAKRKASNLLLTGFHKERARLLYRDKLLKSCCEKDSMPFQLYQQYLDTASGFHIIELRDERGHKHMVQIGVGHDACPACGSVHPKDNLGELDPKAAVAQVNEQLNASQANVLAYARKHGIKVR